MSQAVALDKFVALVELALHRVRFFDDPVLKVAEVLVDLQAVVLSHNFVQRQAGVANAWHVFHKNLAFEVDSSEG